MEKSAWEPPLPPSQSWRSSPPVASAFSLRAALAFTAPAHQALVFLARVPCTAFTATATALEFSARAPSTAFTVMGTTARAFTARATRLALAAKVYQALAFAPYHITAPVLSLRVARKALPAQASRRVFTVWQAPTTAPVFMVQTAGIPRHMPATSSEPFTWPVTFML